MALLLLSMCLNQALAEDPWTTKDLVKPQIIAAEIANEQSPRPTIVFVGFPVLYRGAHVPGAILAGPASKPEGLEALRDALRQVPRNAEIVVYCGCCPFVKCPNIRPAYTALHAMGFSRVKVMTLETNFHTDWTAKGYPVTKGDKR